MEEVSLRLANSPAELGRLAPLWRALNEHHGKITPELAPGRPGREGEASWVRRRAKYERWLDDPDTFFVLAEGSGEPVGYAFVTIGPGYASWATGERLAELETLSVLPGSRSAGIGAALLETVWERLAEIGVEDMAITTTTTNLDARRFYERHGFEQRFAIYYGRRAE